MLQIGDQRPLYDWASAEAGLACLAATEPRLREQIPIEPLLPGHAMPNP